MSELTDYDKSYINDVFLDEGEEFEPKSNYCREINYQNNKSFFDDLIKRGKKFSDEEKTYFGIPKDID